MLFRIAGKICKGYLLVWVPNLILLIVNFIFLFHPEIMDRFLIIEEMQANLLKEITPPPPPEPNFFIESGHFPSGSSLEILLNKKGVSANEMHNLLAAARSTYDLSKVRAGNRYVMEFSKANGKMQRFRYDIDRDGYLSIEKTSDGWEPAIRKHPFKTQEEAVLGVITDSLFQAIIDAGEKDLLALEMSNIFQWDVDFNTDLRVGDAFRILVEKQYLEGEFVKYGSVIAVELSNQGKLYEGFRYEIEGRRPEYYNRKGGSLRRQLRKSPLQFMAPVTSRFTTRRYHPILKRYRPHLGIDYGAPTGTPVVAIAEGKVTRISRDSGGGGNMIRLDHKNSLASMYLHLSRFATALKRGDRVSQGQVIGYVGKTGLATGPHLDFRILQNNKYVNPTKVHGIPADPLPKSHLPGFSLVRDTLIEQMRAVPLPYTVSAGGK